MSLYLYYKQTTSPSKAFPNFLQVDQSIQLEPLQPLKQYFLGVI